MDSSVNVIDYMTPYGTSTGEIYDIEINQKDDSTFPEHSMQICLLKIQLLAQVVT